MLLVVLMQVRLVMAVMQPMVLMMVEPEVVAGTVVVLVYLRHILMVEVVVLDLFINLVLLYREVI